MHCNLHISDIIITATTHDLLSNQSRNRGGGGGIRRHHWLSPSCLVHYSIPITLGFVKGIWLFGKPLLCLSPAHIASMHVRTDDCCCSSAISSSSCCSCLAAVLHTCGGITSGDRAGPVRGLLGPGEVLILGP